MVFHALKVLNITWTDLKAYKTRDSFTFYYVANPNGSYEVIGISSKFIYRSWLSSSSDISDFTTNYLSGATSTPSLDDAIGTANIFNTWNLRDSSGNPINTNLTTGSLFVQQASAPTVDTTESGWIWGTLTTSSLTVDQVVLSYTVPAGKTLYVMYHEVIKGNANAVGAEPTKLFVDSTKLAEVGMPGGNLNTCVYPTSLYAGYPLATAGQTIKITVSPGGNPVTVWGGRIMGALK